MLWCQLWTPIGYGMCARVVQTEFIGVEVITEVLDVVLTVIHSEYAENV